MSSLEIEFMLRIKEDNLKLIFCFETQHVRKKLTASMINKPHSNNKDRNNFNLKYINTKLAPLDRRHRQTLIQFMIQVNSTITYKHINIFPYKN